MAHSAALLAGPQGAPLVPVELPVARSDAWRADLPADSVMAHSAALLAGPQGAPLVPGELPVAHWDEWRADLLVARLVLGVSLAPRSDVSSADPQVARLVPDDLAVHLADGH
jgi:hypothetical protein